MKTKALFILAILLTFVLGTEAQATGIHLTPNPSPKGEGNLKGEGSNYYYMLDGRRIANGQKPTAKGLYIYKGRKIIIN